jgi:hypothetical protein
VQVGRIETPSKDIECAFAGDVDHGISRVVAGRLSRRVIYERHVTEIRREQPDARRIDASRLDAEVAVRMAVTGHSREQIAKAIVDGARASRLHEDRNWQAYARRAAERAFGAPGEHARVRLEPLRDKLLRLEGRQDERQLLRGLGGPARGL